MDKSRAEFLANLRNIPCAQLFPRLCDHAKIDRDFTPIKNGHTERWYVHAGGYDYEILATGPKFFDAHAGIGGGGAIDLAMHLLKLDFKRAVKMLQSIDGK